MTEINAEQPLWIKSYPKYPSWDMDLTPKFIGDSVDFNAQKYPDRPAINFMGKTHSWSEIHISVCRFAKGLQALGLKKGQKVGLFLPNCPLSMIAYYGIMKAGGTVVNYNPLYAVEELAYQIDDSETDIMVTLDLTMLTDKMVEMLSDTRLEKLIVGKFTDYLSFPKNILFPILKSKDQAKLEPSSRIIQLDDVLENDGQYEKVDINLDNDIAVLQYTGGTTGVPKGAMLTHSNIYINAAQAYGYFPAPENNKHDKMMACLPFFHVFAMTVCMNISALGGMEIITLPRFDLQETLKLLNKHKPDFMPAVPAIFTAINNHPKLENYDLTSLKFCISGGAPLPIKVKESFEQKTGCKVVEGYGLSETSPVATVNPPFGEDIEGSIGLPLPGTYIEIIDREDKKTTLPLGERGEICITGPQVMKGYYNKEEATAATMSDGPYGKRLHTGDIGIMDENGYVYIVDRIKDLIITNGYNVYPRNIEEAIYKHPNVEECIVAGLPDEQRGEIVKAWIKLKEGRELTKDDLINFLEDKVSRMEMPKRIEFRAEPLPKTMIGKLSRKDIVAEELDKT